MGGLIAQSLVRTIGPLEGFCSSRVPQLPDFMSFSFSLHGRLSHSIPPKGCSPPASGDVSCLEGDMDRERERERKKQKRLLWSEKPTCLVEERVSPPGRLRVFRAPGHQDLQGVYRASRDPLWLPDPLGLVQQTGEMVFGTVDSHCMLEIRRITAHEYDTRLGVPSSSMWST